MSAIPHLSISTDSPGTVKGGVALTHDHALAIEDPRVKTRAEMAPGEWETRVRLFEMLERAAARAAALAAETQRAAAAPTKSSAATL